MQKWVDRLKRLWPGIVAIEVVLSLVGVAMPSGAIFWVFTYVFAAPGWVVGSLTVSVATVASMGLILRANYRLNAAISEFQEDMRIMRRIHDETDGKYQKQAIRGLLSRLERLVEALRR